LAKAGNQQPANHSGEAELSNTKTQDHEVTITHPAAKKIIRRLITTGKIKAKQTGPV